MINYEKREIHENLLEWFLDHPTLHPSRFRAFRVFRSFKITTYDKPIAKHENKKGDYETRETHESFFVCMQSSQNQHHLVFASFAPFVVKK